MTSSRIVRTCALFATALASPVALVLPQASAAQDVPAPAPVATPAPSGPVRALGGAITPLIGNIRTFTGDIDPQRGNIRTFNGDLTPYIGNIRTFSGEINPYKGNIRTFWGSMSPSSGELDPMIGNIRTFSDSFGASSKSTLSYWLGLGANAPAESYATAGGMISTMIAQSKASWGTQVQSRTGRSFEDAFVAPLLARYGIDLSRPETLGQLDNFSRQMFFLDWNDQLLEYSGYDHIDHWMSSINWSPAITETIGEGKDSVIGLLDFTVTGDATRNITRYDGISTFSNGHGAAVASLMVAAHDGRGVMGIAPMASVVAYNPFDSSGTAGWSDIRNGVLMLAQNNASIINMSLGVPGWTLNQGWNDVFSDAQVAAATRNAVFVAAAGNDGSTQSQNIAWNFATNPSLIVVGSVDPTGQISSFSNRPGTACLLDNGVCRAGNELMNRFITAPGELILVSDGQGGVTRMSGTSFAAPLVSGTIALLHDRWPWLSNYPKESVEIILKSARDVGAPGVDPVYGWGILDVTAAMSPLDFNALKWYTYKDGKISPEQQNKIRNPKEVEKWEAKSMFFYAYEDIGTTFRDFAIPVSSKMVGQTALSANGTTEYLQQYIYSRFISWVNTGGGKSGKGFRAFDSVGLAAALPNSSGLDVTMAVAPRVRTVGFRQPNVPYQSAVRLLGPDERFGITFGEGDGATMMADTSFGIASDFDPVVGGANPLMGYASGGGFLETRVRLDDRWSVSTGLSDRVLKRDLHMLDAMEQAAYGSIDPYHSGAQHLSLTYAVPGAKLTGTYTRLRETNGMFGVQSLDPADFADGTTTDGMSLSSEAALSPSLSVAATATVSRTRPGSGEQNISVSSQGLISTSWQVGVTKNRVFGGRDSARITVAQPMHLERGSVDLQTVQVINRQTGELGPVTQRFNLGVPERQFVGEAQYGRAVMHGSGQLSLFGRATFQGEETVQLPRFVAGAAFQLKY